MECLDGDIAEVLVFQKLLSEDQSADVQKYLSSKYNGINEVVPAPSESHRRQLEVVENPPALQMFLPGFSVHELPVRLPNINNVLYRDDGSLLALAYDGNIYRLWDEDGDGIEESSEYFWENGGEIAGPIGMALTPKGYEKGEGVFVASKGKCSLFVDTDGDKQADREVIVAEGWTQIGHGVDALGVAVDPNDHSILFGLGTKEFTNGFLLDDHGQSQYSLQDERGTILRVAPDFSERRIVCTGIRFPRCPPVQSPQGPLLHRSGRSYLAVQRESVRRAVAHSERTALRLSATASHTPAQCHQRAECV